MKFVTLALTALLALGCHAASLQADDPATYLTQARGSLTQAINQLEAHSRNVAARITDEDTKQLFESAIASVMAKIQNLRDTAEPMTNGFVATAFDATKDMRNSFWSEFEALRADLEPKGEELKKVVNEHIEEYRKKLSPVIAEYQAAQQQHMLAFKESHKEIFDALPTMISTNVEETKGKLMPIITALTDKMAEYGTGLKTLATPYVTEYREQMKAYYEQAQGVDHAAIMEKAKPQFEALKACMNNFINEVQAAMAA